MTGIFNNQMPERELRTGEGPKLLNFLLTFDIDLENILAQYFRKVFIELQLYIFQLISQLEFILKAPNVNYLMY